MPWDRQALPLLRCMALPKAPGCPIHPSHPSMSSRPSSCARSSHRSISKAKRDGREVERPGWHLGEVHG